MVGFIGGCEVDLVLTDCHNHQARFIRRTYTRHPHFLVEVENPKTYARIGPFDEQVE